MAGRARDVLTGSGAVAAPEAAAKQLTGGGYPDLLEHAPAAVLRAGYAAGLDRIFLVSAVLAAVAGVAILILLRPPGHRRPPSEPAGEPATAGVGGA